MVEWSDRTRVGARVAVISRLRGMIMYDPRPDNDSGTRPLSGDSHVEHLVRRQLRFGNTGLTSPRTDWSNHGDTDDLRIIREANFITEESPHLRCDQNHASGCHTTEQETTFTPGGLGLRTNSQNRLTEDTWGRETRAGRTARRRPTARRPMIKTNDTAGRHTRSIERTGNKYYDSPRTGTKTNSYRGAPQ